MEDFDNDDLDYLAAQTLAEHVADELRDEVERLRAENEALRGSIPEWLCETCSTIHTPPEGLDLRCKTPGCDGVLRPSSYNERKLRERVKELEALRKDAERLDWLDKNVTMVSDSERYLPRSVYWGGGTNKDVREAIDAARQRTGDNQ